MNPMNPIYHNPMIHMGMEMGMMNNMNMGMMNNMTMSAPMLGSNQIEY